MIKYKGFGFTCYAVTNMPRARKFYEGKLGWKLARKFSAGFVEYDFNGVTIAVGCAPDQWKPSRHGTTAALEIDDFDGALAHLKKKKIKSAVGPFDFPTCRMVGVRDPDGNIVVLHHRKKMKQGK